MYKYKKNTFIVLTSIFINCISNYVIKFMGENNDKKH